MVKLYLVSLLTKNVLLAVVIEADLLIAAFFDLGHELFECVLLLLLSFLLRRESRA